MSRRRSWWSSFGAALALTITVDVVAPVTADAVQPHPNAAVPSEHPGDTTSWSVGAPACGSSLLTTEAGGNLWLSARWRDDKEYSPNQALAKREVVGSGWESFYPVGGTGDWAAVTTCALETGEVILAGVKNTGIMWTRSFDPDSGWGLWRRHPISSWYDLPFSTTSVPALTWHPGGVTMAAITQTGTLYTKQMSPTGTWSAWGVKGIVESWSPDGGAALGTDADGNVWLVAVKKSGRLFSCWKTEGAPNQGWGNWTRHGVDNWSTTAVPAITPSPGGMTIAAVKAAGTLYTRSYTDGAWGTWTGHGTADSWSPDAGPALGTDPDGNVWLVAVKNFGRLYSRSLAPGQSWGNWAKHGLDNWTTTSAPAVTPRPYGVTIAALKAAGSLYTRNHINGTWRMWLRHGPPDIWAA